MLASSGREVKAAFKSPLRQEIEPVRIFAHYDTRTKGGRSFHQVCLLDEVHRTHVHEVSIVRVNGDEAKAVSVA